MALQTFTNTRYFSEAAITFKRDGHYCKAPKGHPEYKAFWAEQKRRCKEGYQVGDLRITGRHYFYLNFCPIKRIAPKRGSGNDIVVATTLTVKDKISAMKPKELLFPAFWEVDYQWWWAKEIAMNGMYAEEVQSLQIEGLPIRDYLTGYHLACLKTRRAGFSYKEAADGVWNYNFVPNSKSYYFASKDDFLTKDGILNKVTDFLDHLNANTQDYWLKNRMEKNEMMHRKASYLDRRRNPGGFKSEIIGVIVNDPEKVRGKDGIKITFEEAGSFKKLDEALGIAVPSVRDGDIMTGQISIFGCVCTGTEVYKANGEKILIEDLKQEDGILGYDGRGISQEPIVWMQPPAEKECIEITLETGLKLKCSIDHPVLSTVTGWKARRGNGRRVAFIPAEHLNSNYMVAVMESIPVFGDKYISAAYTLGYLLGDGYYGGTMEVIIDNEISLNRIESEVSKIELKREYSETLASYSIGGDIRQTVKINGMWGQSKQAKRFPKNWQQYDKESLASLLAGYFDADGNVKKNKVGGINIIYSSTVKELLEETKEALLKFGIHSNLCKELSKGGYTEEHIIYRLYIGRAKSVYNFKEYIKPLNPWKQVPNQDKRVCRILDEGKYHESKPLGEDYKNKLLTGAVLYRVLSVKPIGKQKIYNLNAGKTHSYLANNIITHNTGGEEGPSMEGLESVFNTPEAYDVLPFNNIWEEGMEATLCGYYVPCFKTYSNFMDEDGNIDIEGAIAYDDTERAKKKLLPDPKKLDRRTAEYSRNPSEALQRLSNNIFPTNDVLQWIKEIRLNPAITAFIRHGIVFPNKDGIWKFELNPDAKPVLKYPHDQDDNKDRENLEGCITIYEEARCDIKGNVFEGLYSVVVDPYYKDQAEDLTSLWACYVIKHKTSDDPYGDKIVASFIGRPMSLTTAYRNTLGLSEIYNCKIQSEIAGGGQGLFDFLKTEKKMHKIEFEPTQFNKKENGANQKNRNYFMNLSTDEKKNGLSYFAEWLLKPRGIDFFGNTLRNLHTIYDIALLQEIVKYNGVRNADRISAMIVAMFTFKEATILQINVSNEEKSEFFNRAGFGSSDQNNTVEDYISLDQMVA